MAHSSHFERATAVSRLGDGVYGAEVSEDFWIATAPNGGYLCAIALRAALASLASTDADRPPRSLHVRFLAAPKAGPIEVATEIVRRGRSMTIVAVRMRQDAREFLAASFCFSVGFSTLEFQDARMPEALPLERAKPVEKVIALNQRFDMLRAIGDDARNGERAVTGGYIRFADPHLIDAPALATLWDVWPPAVFTRRIEQRVRGAVPTVEASVYFRREVPLAGATPSDYLLLKFETTAAHAGFVEESGEIWSADGLLLVQSRQLALVM